MNITVHIERLILDGLSPGPLDTRQLSGAVQAELERLLAESGLHRDLATGGALGSVRGGDIAGLRPEAGSLGAQIAVAIHDGLGGQEGATR